MEWLASAVVSLGLMSEHCASEFFLRLNVFNVVCLKLLVSRGLSLAIIGGSFFLKVPQILAMVRARSAKGLTFAMFASETFVFATGGAYGFRKGLPVSTYLENWVILAQVVAICLLMFHYNGQTILAVVFSVAAAGFVFSLTHVLAVSYVEWAFTLIIPILIYGRAPQIYYNFRAKDTGTLSFLSIFMSFAGGLARIFTFMQEAPSTLILTGLVIGVLLNGIMLVQILMYSSKSKKTAGGVAASGARQKSKKA